MNWTRRDWEWLAGVLVTVLVAFWGGRTYSVYSSVTNNVPASTASTVTATAISYSTLTTTTTTTLQPPALVTLSGTAVARAIGTGTDKVRFTDESGAVYVANVTGGKYMITIPNGHTYTAEVHWVFYPNSGWSTAVIFDLEVKAGVQTPLEFDL
jgi:hypothetical protein